MEATLVTATLPDELSPLEAAIMDGCNAVHEATRLGDEEALNELRLHLEDLLSRYDASDGEDHPNPAWARATQRALVRSAFGLIDEAIQLEKTALRYADSARRMEISLGNLAERCLRLDRNEDAVRWFLEAAEVAPASVPVMLTGAQALYRAGFLAEADRIFESFESNPAHLDPGSELTAYLEYEGRLTEMASALPALERLLGAWRGGAS